MSSRSSSKGRAPHGIPPKPARVSGGLRSPSPGLYKPSQSWAPDRNVVPAKQSRPRSRSPKSPNRPTLDTYDPTPRVYDVYDPHPESSPIETIQVIIRIRPPPTEEEGWINDNSNKVQRATRGREIYRLDGSPAWKWDKHHILYNPSKTDLLHMRTGHEYSFSRIFPEDTDTQDLYNRIGLPLVQRCFEGYNGCIMAYGQTNSGKTYTISGNSKTTNHMGFISYAVNDFFNYIARSPDRISLLRVAFLEVYNEQLKDLLCENQQPTLIIMDDQNARVAVANATEKVVRCLQDVKDLHGKGETKRMMGKNNVHDHASRSHTIFQLIFESRHKDEEECRVSTLNIVDLAGSEHTSVDPVYSKKKKSESEREADAKRDREGNNIRKSLLALTRVVSILAEGTKDHIPYRDSKLTRILRPALGGNSSTVIIATVNPWMSDTDDKETNATLRFASMAKQISNRPEQVMLTKDEGLLDYYQGQLRDLRTQMLTVTQQKKLSQQEKDTLEAELQNTHMTAAQQREALMKKYDNLAKFILTSKNVEENDDNARSRGTTRTARKLKRRSNSFDCARDADSLSLTLQYGYLKKYESRTEEGVCEQCKLKDSMLVTLQTKVKQSDIKKKETLTQLEVVQNHNTELQERVDELEAMVKELEHKSHALTTEEEKHLALQEKHTTLEEEQDKLQKEVDAQIKALKEQEALLEETKAEIEAKIAEIEESKNKLEEHHETNKKLNEHIETEKQKNTALDAEIHDAVAERLAFERYYQNKKDAKKFKTIRGVFEKKKPQDYKPWTKFTPSPEVVKQHRRVSVGAATGAGGRPASGSARTNASVRSSSMPAHRRESSRTGSDYY